MNRLVLALLFAPLGIVVATVTTTNPSAGFSAWMAAINALTPGDTLIFQSGEYLLTSRFGVNLIGKPNAPITLAGAPGAVFHRADTNQNCIDITGTDYIIRGLEFNGGDKGIRVGPQQNASNAVFENLVIHDTGGTAFSCNDGNIGYKNITIRNVEVYNTGSLDQANPETNECFYLGCNNNACWFTDSLVENVFCHDTYPAKAGGYGAGLQIKAGSFRNIVRNSVFWNVPGVGIFFYDAYDGGANIADGNLVVNTGQQGIQFSAGATITNNIVVNSAAEGLLGAINELKTGTNPRNLKIIGNTVIVTSGYACLRGNGCVFSQSQFGDSNVACSWTTANANTYLIANNAFFCEGGTAFNIATSITAATTLNNGFIGSNSNFPASGLFAIKSVANELIDAAGWNFFPRANSTLLNKGAAQATIANNWSFNCAHRSAATPTVGALEVRSGLTSYAVTKGFKTCPSNGGGGSSSSTGGHHIASSSSSSSTAAHPSSSSTASHASSSGGQVSSAGRAATAGFGVAVAVIVLVASLF